MIKVWLTNGEKREYSSKRGVKHLMKLSDFDIKEIWYRGKLYTGAHKKSNATAAFLEKEYDMTLADTLKYLRQ